jgi:predicted DNA-binding transcriptional regulator YafY
MTQWARSSPVRVRLSRAQAARLAEDWYFRFARFEEIAKDEVVMTYGENDPEKVFALVRWLGPGAELLEPVEWRARLGAELGAMAQAYLIPARRAGNKVRPPSSARRRSS